MKINIQIGNRKQSGRWGVVVVRRNLAIGSVIVVAIALLFGVIGANAFSTSSTSYTLKASLNTKAVASLKDASGANGTLSGKLVVAGKKSSFTWTLTLHHLSGTATHADIYFGTGKKVSLALPLCVKCQLPSAHGAYVGPYVATQTFVKTVLRGGAYAIIATKLNPKGEIRGQIKATSA